MYICYFDESYDGNHDFLTLGTLFNPQPHKIHNEFAQAKRNLNYVNEDGSLKEIKYAKCDSHSKYKIAREAIDCFAESTSTFRCIVVDQRPESGFNWNYFGSSHEDRAIKQARAYKVFTELLLKSNCSAIKNGVLFADRLSRCTGDKFIPLIKESFGQAGVNYSSGLESPIFRHVQEVDPALEQYHVGQIEDLLQGVIINEICPGHNKYKRKLREYVKRRLSLPSLSRNYWENLPRWKQDQIHMKYQVWYWKPS